MNLNGYWEKEGRNPLVGAVIGVLALGSLYFFIGGLVANIIVLLDMVIRQDFEIFKFSGNLIETLKEYYRRVRVPMLSVTMAGQFFFFVFGTLWVFGKSHGTGAAQYLKLKKVNPLGIVVGVVSGIFMVSVSSFLSYYIYILFPVLKELSAVSEALFHAEHPVEWGFMILTIGVTPAICEELLFRGYLQGTLERKMREPWLYLFSGVLFALYHRSNLSLLSLIAVGIYLGFLFHRFQSIYVTMVLHFTYNSLIVILVNKPFLPMMFNHTDPVSLTILGISASGLILIITLVILLVKPKSECFNPPPV